jgi:DNA-binding response OmpR family regulator
MPANNGRLLLIDDDIHLVEVLKIKLQNAGFSVDTASVAVDGHKLALKNVYDLIILDLVMPHQSGLEICLRLREKGILTPILILSGRTKKEIVIQGLEAGADDYLTKPFSGNELIARIKALLRRNNKTFQIQIIECNGIELDTLTNVAKYKENSIFLTSKETQLLQRLMSDAPKPILREVLLHDVWGIHGDHASNRLDVYIRRLRIKLKTLFGHSIIKTVRGSGYQFDVEKRK